MTKLFSMLICLLILTGCNKLNTSIQDIGRGSAYAETVARTKELHDDTWVTLTGKIIRSLGDNLYIFQDPSDEIRVQIPEKAWLDIRFNPQMKVKITGKVYQSPQGIQINVDQVEQVTE